VTALDKCALKVEHVPWKVRTESSNQNDPSLTKLIHDHPHPDAKCTTKTNVRFSDVTIPGTPGFGFTYRQWLVCSGKRTTDRVHADAPKPSAHKPSALPKNQMVP
jgi:hypothetical protein